MMERVIRRHACAAGRVQGVGFRMFVRQQAVMNDITGWVMNMSDGTVTMELQGDAAAVEAAVDAALADGKRTADIYIADTGCTQVGTREMADAVLAHL